MTLNTLSCTILTPYTKLLEENNLSMVLCPGREGDLGLMAGHLLLVTQLRSGVIKLLRQGEVIFSMDVDEDQQITLNVTPSHVFVMMEKWCPLSQGNPITGSVCMESPLRIESLVYGTYKIDRDVFKNMSSKRLETIRHYLTAHKGAYLSKNLIEEMEG